MVRWHRWRVAASALLVLSQLACGSEDEQAVVPGGGVGGSGGGADDSAVYDPERVLAVDIELAAADWESLRREGRDLSVLAEGCHDGPPPKIYTYFPATVTIDGETVEQVGVRKKGFLGSLLVSRPSLKLKFDEYVAAQRYHTMKRMTLNNNKQDPSLVRQCLTMGLFAAAGQPASRCNYARVTVNGEDLGIYTHLESIKKPFLRRHFSDDDGNLYEGQRSDFRPELVQTFEVKTNDSGDHSDLTALTAALDLPLEQIVPAVEPLVDLDAFGTFWALESLVGAWDGYSNNLNNFYVYHDPSSDRFHFIPWSPDMAYTTEEPFTFVPRPQSVSAAGKLPFRLYSTASGRQQYVEGMHQLLAEVWDEDALVAEVDRLEALLAPHPDAAGLAQIRDFILHRREALEAEMAEAPPSWPLPLSTPSCAIDDGPVSGTFETSWGTLDQPNSFAAGTGTLVMSIAGEPQTFTLFGATAGTDEGAGAFSPTVRLFGLREDNSVVVVVLFVEAPLFEPNSDVSFHGFSTFGVVGTVEGGQLASFGFVTAGSIGLVEASTGMGGGVTGSFTGEVVRSQ